MCISLCVKEGLNKDVIHKRTPPCRSKHYTPHNSDVLKRSFIYNGSVIWNNLPDEIRMATDVVDFKWMYKCLILNPLFENG